LFEELSDLIVDPAAAHVAVLSHRNFGVPEVVRTDARGQSGIVNQRRKGLTEAVRADVWDAQFVTGSAPLPREVVEVAHFG
jgi:hypothetical protein